MEKKATKLACFILLQGLVLRQASGFSASPHYSRKRWESQHSASTGSSSSAFSLCPSLPEAAVSAEKLLSRVEDLLLEADAQIKAALNADKSPGGVALSLIYSDQVLWKGGYGLKNMSGM